MKKPGSPLAGRAALECTVRFCEGNGACVHRLEPPGGVPFCVARFRVVFYHSLSQGLLLKRNLNSVFFRVNNLMQFFFRAPAVSKARNPENFSRERMHVCDRMRARCARAKKNHLFHALFFFRARASGSTHANREAPQSARSERNGSCRACVRGAKKICASCIAQADLRELFRRAGTSASRYATVERSRSLR